MVSEVARLEQLAPEERLNPGKADAGFEGVGKGRRLFAGRGCHRVARREGAQGGDIVVVFSNGGFGGIHAKLLERLGRR